MSGCMARPPRSGEPTWCSAPRRSYQRAVPVVQTLDGGPYALDTGDKLRIVVFGQDALSNNYTVDAQGQVTLPLIGAVRSPRRDHDAVGQCDRRTIEVGLRSADPSVAVEIDTYRPFFVLGEVAYPGQYPFVPNMTVENAIAIAGGFTPRASKDKVTISRKVQGAAARYVLPLRYPLRPGDTIEVAERWF